MLLLRVAILIAIVGASADLAVFRHAWAFIASCAVASSGAAALMGSTVRRTAEVGEPHVERVPLPGEACASAMLVEAS
jgi:hypothetical protein